MPLQIACQIEVEENKCLVKEHNIGIDSVSEVGIQKSNSLTKEHNASIYSMIEAVVPDNKIAIKENIVEASDAMTLIDFIKNYK